MIYCHFASVIFTHKLYISLGTLVSSINKTDRCDITEILLKVAINTITLTHKLFFQKLRQMERNFTELHHDHSYHIKFQTTL